MFKKMLTPGVVACFLRPAHAAHLRVTLDMLESQQAIVALVPEPQTAWMLLHCEDFASDIAAGRLWFAVGAHWESQLAELFVANPGLPTPSQFIRPIAIDNEGADVMIGPGAKSLRRGKRPPHRANPQPRRGLEASGSRLQAVHCRALPIPPVERRAAHNLSVARIVKRF